MNLKKIKNKVLSFSITSALISSITAINAYASDNNAGVDISGGINKAINTTPAIMHCFINKLKSYFLSNKYTNKKMGISFSRHFLIHRMNPHHLVLDKL